MSDFDLSHLLDNIKTGIFSVLEKELNPFFEIMKTNNANIKAIECILKQMPEFKQLEKENKELKEILAEKQDKIPDLIKLNIVETSVRAEVINESEMYKNANLTGKLVNKQLVDVVEEEAEEEAEASEAEEEAEASEAEEEAEASEAEEEASEAEVEEEEEASEAAEEEVEEEEEASEAAEEEVEEEAEEEVEEEEEVSLVEIKGHGNFYTTNQVNGDIYKIDADEEVGEQVGKFVSSIPVFF